MITTITLNASIDKVYKVEGPIVLGTVMRVASCRCSAGGKGLNVARVISLCGEEVAASGFVGGYQGDYLLSLLGGEIHQEFVRVKGETRSCINILTPDRMSTEFLEPGAMVSGEEAEKFLKVYSGLAEKSSVITLSGSAPRGVEPEMYGKLVAIAKQKGRQVILDTSGECLAAGIKALPTMIKPNKEEMEALTNAPVRDRQDLIERAMELHKRGIELVAVSLGADGAVLVCEEGVFRAVPPAVEAVNTVGCGDSMVAAFAVSLNRGYDRKRALGYAVAVSAANAMHEETGKFRDEDLHSVLPRVTIEQIK